MRALFIRGCMIFKDLRLSGRFGKAHGLLLKEKYECSYELLVSVLDAGPEEFLLPFIHEDLGVVEYHRGNFEASLEHMEFCIQHSVENPQLRSSPNGFERFERIFWYHKASERKKSEKKNT